MNKISVFIGLSLMVIVMSFNYSNSADEDAIRALVETSYVNGAFNDLNPDAMEKAFYPDFAIFSAKGEQLARYEISDWVSSVRKKKNDPNFDPLNNKWDHKIDNIDVTGNAASLKIRYFRKGDLVYTDYLSLLKFETGWKIVAKVYEFHGKSK